MDPSTLPPISGHAIFLLLVQLALLLFLARTLAEVMRRMGQPAVIGELLAGILLGPTILGYWAPDVFLTIFPQDVAQFHLLEVISWLGLVLLLLLTGLETDVRVVRSLGPAALFASAGGLIVLFSSGFALGSFLPDSFLVNTAQRPLFAALLATALAITALPVIGKILIDLDLIKRDVGVIILSAGVVDDTIGWLVLGVIAGIAEAGSFSISRLGFTLAGLAVFLVAMRWVLFPLFARLVRYINENVKMAGADLTLMLVGTYMTAAATEALGVHAVFGAFVFGLLVRQLPRLRAASVHTLEVFVLSGLSPIFFAFVGLKVNLWTLTGWQVPLLVIGIAVFGKTIGCYVGSRLGGMKHWESLAVGFGMNARGAMGLIVALLGLSLGLLTPEMFSIIVLMAIVTSFLAPVLLRAVIPKLTLSQDEERRLADDEAERLIPAGPLRVLVPTAGGGNALGAFALAAPLVKATNGSVTALFVAAREEPTMTRLLRRLMGNPSLAGKGLETHLAQVGERLGDQKKLLTVKRVRSTSPADAVIEEQERDYDLLMIGAAPRHLVGRSMIVDVLGRTKLPSVIVRATEAGLPKSFAHLMVPVDGSVFSREAAEFALAYAQAADAQVTLLHVVDETWVAGSLLIPDRREAHSVDDSEAARIEAQIREDFSALAERYKREIDVRILGSGDPAGAIIAESWSGYTDLVVLGAENKLLSQPLFFGQGTAAIVERAGCTTAVVIPRFR